MNKKHYIIPTIRIQEIDSEDIMENPMSIPIYSDSTEVIEDGSEILTNKHSVWDE